MTTHFCEVNREEGSASCKYRSFWVAEFIFSDDLTKLHYRVILKNIEKVTSCQIHLGKSAQIGPIVFICTVR